MAAEVLVDWVRKMSDAELPIVDEAPAKGPAVYVGAAAVEAGLDLTEIKSPSNEGVRVHVVGSRVLVAGQCPTATVKAVCRLLETWGCRYFVDHPQGEVYPRTKNLAAGPLDLQEKPGFRYRKIWGSRWTGSTLWKIWNGAGGEPMATGHAWGRYVDKGLFDEHPEYFRMRDAEREPSDWYCTSNAALAQAVCRWGDPPRIESRVSCHPSISPPDGRGYCQLRGLHGGRTTRIRSSPPPVTVCISEPIRRLLPVRGQARGRALHPDSILSFYCYADYTQAPTGGVRLGPNLCAWIAPIRYCRFHRHREIRAVRRASQLASNSSTAGARSARAGSPIAPTTTTWPSAWCPCR